MATAELDVSVHFGCEELSEIYSGVTAAIVRITPEEAGDMLACNRKNRKLDKRNVSLLRDAIAQGEWYMNGEAIIFSADGALLNGQHRLHAIIAAGVSVDVLVVRGVDPESFKTLDSGRVRRAGEVLAMDGEKNGNNVASAIQALLAFVDAGGRLYGGSCGHGRKATAATCQRVLQAHPAIRDSVREMGRNPLYRSQHATLLHYLFSGVSKHVAQAFSDVMAEGSSDIGRPFVLFRESLVRCPVCSENRLSYAAKAIKAFNAELSGDRPKMFKFLASEEFPTIAGLNYERLAESLG
jgi:hypothetical protein